MLSVKDGLVGMTSEIKEGMSRMINSVQRLDTTIFQQVTKLREDNHVNTAAVQADISLIRADIAQLSSRISNQTTPVPGALDEKVLLKVCTTFV